MARTKMKKVRFNLDSTPRRSPRPKSVTDMVDQNLLTNQADAVSGRSVECPSTKSLYVFLRQVDSIHPESELAKSAVDFVGQLVTPQLVRCRLADFAAIITAIDEAVRNKDEAVRAKDECCRILREACEESEKIHREYLDFV